MRVKSHFDSTYDMLKETNNGSVKNYTYNNEVNDFGKPLTPEFSDAYADFDFQFSKVKSNPVGAISSGRLKMYAVEQSTVVKDFTEFLNKLEAAYPAFRRICEKPKSHLKAINEVRPIETVKRVGYESIPYLASHSEDWLAKTASGLKPARLFSRVEDEEFQIYENRVVKTAIDLICLFLKRYRTDLVYKERQLEGIISSRVQTNSFGFDAGFYRAVSELIPSDSIGDEYRSKQHELAERLLEKATVLLRKYRILHNSKLYRYLRRAKNVINPLNETNILLLDKDYSVIFKLWKNIHKDYSVIFKLWKNIQKVIAQRKSEEVRPDDAVDKDKSYKLFCRVLCEYTAHTMKFIRDREDIYVRKSDNLQVSVDEEFEQIVITITDVTKRELKVERPLVCPIKDGEVWGKFEYNNHTLYWRNDITAEDIEELCALLKNKESRGKDLEKERKLYFELKGALEQKQREYGLPKSTKIAIITVFCDVEDETRNRFSEHMKSKAKSLLIKSTDIDYVVIAMPKCQSNEEKLTTYAKRYGEKIAFLPLTMFDINSYRRLQGIFLRMILKIGNGKCPYCGSNMRGNDSRYECMGGDCKLLVTNTICDEPSCKHKFTYLSYTVREEVLKKMQGIGPDDFHKYDSMFQYKDIVPLAVGNEIKPKITPICPKCGK